MPSDVPRAPSAAGVGDRRAACPPARAVGWAPSAAGVGGRRAARPLACSVRRAPSAAGLAGGGRLAASASSVRSDGRWRRSSIWRLRSSIRQRRSSIWRRRRSIWMRLRSIRYRPRQLAESRRRATGLGKALRGRTTPTFIQHPRHQRPPPPLSPEAPAARRMPANRRRVGRSLPHGLVWRSNDGEAHRGTRRGHVRLSVGDGCVRF